MNHTWGGAMQLGLMLGLVGLVAGQEGGRRASSGRDRPGSNTIEAVDGDRIAWFGTLESGRAEAARMARPILLISAQPHCREAPGVW